MPVLVPVWGVCAGACMGCLYWCLYGVSVLVPVWGVCTGACMGCLYWCLYGVSVLVPVWGVCTGACMGCLILATTLQCVHLTNLFIVDALIVILPYDHGLTNAVLSHGVHSCPQSCIAYS